MSGASGTSVEHAPCVAVATPPRISFSSGLIVSLPLVMERAGCMTFNETSGGEPLSTSTTAEAEAARVPGAPITWNRSVRPAGRVPPENVRTPAFDSVADESRAPPDAVLHETAEVASTATSSATESRSAQ
eukprot:2646873-Prymnesium_polylepis.1